MGNASESEPVSDLPVWQIRIEEARTCQEQGLLLHPDEFDRFLVEAAKYLPEDARERDLAVALIGSLRFFRGNDTIGIQRAETPVLLPVRIVLPLAEMIISAVEDQKITPLRPGQDQTSSEPGEVKQVS